MRSLCVAICLLMLGWAAPAFGIEAGSAAPSFNLESGDQQTLSLDQIRGKVILILYETKEEVEQNRALKSDLTALYAGSPLLKTRSLVVSVINASSAYWPITKIWQSNLRKNSEKEGVVIWGDWNGKMFSDYGMTDRASNVVLIDKKGVVRYARSGRLAPDDIRHLKKMLLNAVEK